MSNLAFSQVKIDQAAPFEEAFTDIIAHLLTIKDDSEIKLIGEADWGLKIFEQTPHENMGIVARLFAIEDTLDNVTDGLLYGLRNCTLVILLAAYATEKGLNTEKQWRRIEHRVLDRLQTYRTDHTLGLARNDSKYQFRGAPTAIKPEDTWKGMKGQVKLNPNWSVRGIRIPMKAFFNNF